MESYRVKSGEPIDLDDFDPDDHSGFSGDKQDAVAHLATLNQELEGLQELLYAQRKNKLLIILQGMDTSGKDGVIRNVFDGVNPQGVKVASFKVPTAEELDHDYLWRVHKVVPGQGEMVIFNRSHYEDVLVVRVHNLVPEEVWSKRYEQINHFEQLLVAEGTLVRKFFLHISKDEQKQRLEARLADSTKQWKFSLGDLKERALWKDYKLAYEAVLEKTSTEWAPWYIVPANRKWYRDLVISEVIVKALKNLKMSYPTPTEDLSLVVID